MLFVCLFINMDQMFNYMNTYKGGYRSRKYVTQKATEEISTKWIEICNKSESINKTLRIMQEKYGKSFPVFLDLNPDNIRIINLTVFYSNLCLDMLSDEVETISIHHTFNSKVKVIITRSYPLLKNIIIDIDNIKNISNLEELSMYAHDNNINLHFIDSANSGNNVNLIVETCI